MPEPVTLAPTQNFGRLLREWRGARQVSQLDLALRPGASQRSLYPKSSPWVGFRNVRRAAETPFQMITSKHNHKPAGINPVT